MDSHPKNYGGQYTVLLQDTLYLDSSWEVALVEGIYRKDWPVVREGENIILYEYPKETFHPKEWLKWRAFEKRWSEIILPTPISFTFNDKIHFLEFPEKTQPLPFGDFMEKLTDELKKKVKDLHVESFNNRGIISMRIPPGFFPSKEMSERLDFPQVEALRTFEWRINQIKPWLRMDQGLAVIGKKGRREKYNPMFDEISGKIPTSVYQKVSSTEPSHFMTPFPTNKERRDDIVAWLENLSKTIALKVDAFESFVFNKEKATFEFVLKKSLKDYPIDGLFAVALRLPRYPLDESRIDDKSEEDFFGKKVTRRIPLLHYFETNLTRREEELYTASKKFWDWWTINISGKSLVIKWKGKEYTSSPFTNIMGSFPDNLQTLNKWIQDIVPGWRYELNGEDLKVKFPNSAELHVNQLFYDLELLPTKALETFPYHVKIKPWPLKKPIVEVEREEVQVTSGYYANAKTFLDAINFQLENIGKKGGDKLSVALTENENYMSLTVDPGAQSQARHWWKLSLSQSLYEQLGISKLQLTTAQYYSIKADKVPNYLEDMTEEQSLKTFTLKGRRPIDVHRGVDTLWIYSNIIESQRVGNRQVPLLRIIPARGENYGETVVINYDKPHYVGLSKNVFSSVEINIYNTYGISPIQFASDVILKLHFRKKSI